MAESSHFEKKSFSCDRKGSTTAMFDYIQTINSYCEELEQQLTISADQVVQRDDNQETPMVVVEDTVECTGLYNSEWFKAICKSQVCFVKYIYI